MDISGYASLFEISIGLLAVSGLITENIKNRTDDVQKQLDEIYSSKEHLPISEKVNDYIDLELDDIEIELEDKLFRMRADLNYYSLISVLLMVVPVVLLYLIGRDYRGVSAFWLHVLLIISLLGGPCLLWISKDRAIFHVRHLNTRIKQLRRCVVRNKIIE